MRGVGDQAVELGNDLLPPSQPASRAGLSLLLRVRVAVGEILGGGYRKESAESRAGCADLPDGAGDVIPDRGMRGAEAGKTAALEALDIRMLLKEGERHRAGLVEIEIDLQPMPCAEADQLAEPLDPLLPSIGERGIEWEFDQLVEDRLKPDAVHAALGVFAEKPFGKGHRQVGVERSSVKPLI